MKTRPNVKLTLVSLNQGGVRVSKFVYARYNDKGNAEVSDSVYHKLKSQLAQASAHLPVKVYHSWLISKVPRHLLPMTT